MNSNARKRKPKSFKADGTPKKRWTAAERAARGHKPRTRGGVERHRDGSRTDSRGRTFQPFVADQESTERDPRRRGDSRGRGEDRRQGSRRDDWHSRDGGGRGDRKARRDGWKRDDRGQDWRAEGRDRRDRWQREDRRDDWASDDRRKDRARDNRRRDWNRDDRRRDWSRDGHRDDRKREDHRDDRPRRDRDDRPRREDRRRHEDHRGWGGHQGDQRGWDGRRDDREDRRDGQGPADTMEWQSRDLGDLDTSGVDHETGFAAMGVPDRIVAALGASGITSPFRIQVAAIPDAIAGRDVLGRASTGSGKTLAFGVPVLTRLSSGNRPDGRPRALVLSPTRELAMQIADVLSPLANAVGLSTVLVAGGMSYGPQTKAFRRGVDLVVATPGRLVDLLETGDADLSGVEVTVLDEADHMADLGFMEAVGAILDAVPEDGQRLLFSATLDDAVSAVVKRYLHDPVTHEVDPERGAVATATHHSFHVRPHEKVPLMCEIAHREGHTIVFARTQRGASRMAEQMREAGVMAGALHGGLTQGARARVLAAFKDGSLPVLVATDVAARGIDVDDVSLVLQVDPPMNSKDYLHRAGRTARAGQRGAVVSLVLPHQRRTMTRLFRGAGVHPVEAQVGLGDEHVAEVTGCSPVPGEPIAQADYDALVAPRPQPRAAHHRRHGGSRGPRQGDRRRGGKGRRDRDQRQHGSGQGGRGARRADRDPRAERERRYGRSGNDTW